MGEHRKQTTGEEIANSVTHGVGAILSMAGLVILVVLASMHGDVWQIVSCAIFGLTMFQMYLASTLYHAIQTPRIKEALRIFDHAAIYLLIAGTYTPFTLITLRGAWGWSLFGVVWGLAVAGIIFKIFFIGRFPKVSTTIYIAMGWIAIIAIRPIIENLPFGGLMLLLGGGIAYTSGVIFYAWESQPYAHSVWHLFVLGGTVCHFLCVMFYLIP